MLTTHTPQNATTRYFESDGTGVDKLIAPNIRLWMVLSMVAACLLVMTIAVCCVMKIRIPRSKREIERDSSRRKKESERKKSSKTSMSAPLEGSFTPKEAKPAKKQNKNVILMQSFLTKPPPLSRNSTMQSLEEVASELSAEEANADADAEQQLSERSELLPMADSGSRELNNNNNGSLSGSRSTMRGSGLSVRVVKEAVV